MNTKANENPKANELETLIDEAILLWLSGTITPPGPIEAGSLAEPFERHLDAIPDNPSFERHPHNFSPWEKVADTVKSTLTGDQLHLWRDTAGREMVNKEGWEITERDAETENLRRNSYIRWQMIRRLKALLKVSVLVTPPENLPAALNEAQRKGRNIR